MTPCFAATYPALNGEATRPWTEATTRIRPSPLALQVRPGVAGEQERAREEHRQERVPAVLVELLERGDVLEARVRDHRVEPPNCSTAAATRRPVALARRQVGGERLARAVRIRRAIDRQHLPPVSDEPLRDRTADAARGTGDERAASGHGPPRT